METYIAYITTDMNHIMGHGVHQAPPDGFRLDLLRKMLNGEPIMYDSQAMMQWNGNIYYVGIITLPQMLDEKHSINGFVTKIVQAMYGYGSNVAEEDKKHVRGPAMLFFSQDKANVDQLSHAFIDALEAEVANKQAAE